MPEFPLALLEQFADTLEHVCPDIERCSYEQDEIGSLNFELGRRSVAEEVRRVVISKQKEGTHGIH